LRRLQERGADGKKKVICRSVRILLQFLFEKNTDGAPKKA
jgi:hypothetical protein